MALIGICWLTCTGISKLGVVLLEPATVGMLAHSSYSKFSLHPCLLVFPEFPFNKWDLTSFTLFAVRYIHIRVSTITQYSTIFNLFLSSSGNSSCFTKPMLTKYYPTPEEQHRFIRAYLMHTPNYKNPGAASSNPPTPHLGPLPTSASTTAQTATAAPSSISAFMLDSRAPPGQSYQEQEAQAERKTEEEARRLMAETKLWRIANSAMWVAWGIVQAHVPGLPETDTGDGAEKGNTESSTAAALDGATADIKIEAEAEEKKTEAVSTKADEPEDDTKPEPKLDKDADLFKSQDDEEFDYLAYAQDRAMFVWGDLVNMGLVKQEELPEELRKRLKIVEY